MVVERAGLPIGLVANVHADWLSELEATGPFPERTVVVRSEAVAHAWRRELVDTRPELLIGTRFITPISAAVALLESLGVSFTLGEEAVRSARIASILAEDLKFEAFSLEVLRGGRGWGDALASTMNELESACIDIPALRGSSDPRCRDIATLRDRLDTAANESWTIARLLREAAARLRADSRLWPFDGAVLVEVTGHEDVAMANWLRAIPNSRIVSIATQPRRSAYVERVRNRFGELALQTIEIATTNELGLLATYLFSAPDVLAATDRPRSPGNDGTVQIEEHAGLEEELDAVVTWVIGEIGDCGTPLEQIGIVVPQLDPYAALLAARLDVLLPDCVCVLGGVPATGTSAGARIGTFLRALESHLHLDVLAELLPTVELSSDDVHLSRADAIAALYQLGTVGGSAANPNGALEWVPRNQLRQASLVDAIAASSDDADRETEAKKRALRDLRAISSTLEAIDRVARLLIANATLAELWTELEAVLSAHLRIGVDGQRILSILDEALRPLLEAQILRGAAALAAIRNALAAVRMPLGRFGEPRITIVPLSDAAGLSFRTVRVLGLAEGSIPSNVREDAVLPDSVRRTLGPGMPLAADRTVAQLHALHRAVIGTTDRIVLSVARMDSQRRYREPSGALLEAMAALGRPPLGTQGLTIPDARILRQQAFEPARHELRTLRTRWPVHGVGRLDRAVRRRQVPRAWRSDRIRSIDRLITETSLAPSPMDGWFPEGAFVELPGLTEERPISASALARLIECPHRFLYERVLGWKEPPELIDEGNIDALSYGSLFHETAETFYRTHGTLFCTRTRALHEWKAVGDAVADQHFDAFIATYPLTGIEIRGAARRRLRRDLRALLDSDWQGEKRFVDVERAFGPLPLDIGEDSRAYVHGFIDRIDTIGSKTLVRDLKTGRAKRRKSVDDLRPSYDIQLGLYGLVTKARAHEWGVPALIDGAYVYPSDPSGDERSFYGDFEMLETATRGWIRTGIGLLETRRFPRTPDAADCSFCAFKAVCGETRNERAMTLLAGSVGALAALAALKIGDDDE